MTGTNTGIVTLELAILVLDRAVQYLDYQQKKAFITEDLSDCILIRRASSPTVFY
ncbi:hypothetical protein [Peribacillus frigoritolerans]|uniref:hypothetical protein n=1 Tax=Peribacillus frigoritolerans TaxID=450367 RepID=UPI0021AABCFB|nr:hypothetical protein [Peribacillus frigoritolerans]